MLIRYSYETLVDCINRLEKNLDWALKTLMAML